MIICKKCAAELPDDALFCLRCGASQAPRKRTPRRRGNGEGTVYKLPSGKYRAMVTLNYYIDANGALKRNTATGTFVKKADAVAALVHLKEQGAARKPKDLTLRELYDQYTSGKEYARLSRSQQDKLHYAWRRFKPLEFRGITTLTVDDIQTTIDNAVSTYYPARDMKVCLSHLYQLAIRKELVSYNKTEYIDLPEAPKAKRECWTKDEVNAMWKDYESNPFTGYMLIMCYAGLRYGEVSTILLENIHLEQDYMIGGIKTEAGIDREIPIHSRIKPIIETFMSERKVKLMEMKEDRFYESYWAMVARTGIRELPPQTCRHYYFSSMTAAGVQGGVIAETGGHASFLTTMKNYVRIPLADKLKAVNTIE